MNKLNAIIMSFCIFTFINPLFYWLYTNHLDDRNDITSWPLHLLPVESCAEFKEISFFKGDDSWFMLAKVQINNELLTFTDFQTKKQKIVWNDHVGSFELNIDYLQELPPVKVKLLLDTEQQTLYSTKYPLDQSETIRREKEFWHALANAIVHALTFDRPPGEVGDIVAVYHVSREHHNLASSCSTAACTDSAAGVFNTILDTVELAYKGKTSLSERETIIKLFDRDERPSRSGEKVVIIIRWRSDPLSKNSYPFDDLIFKGRLVVIAIDRSFSLPADFAQLAQDVYNNYGAKVFYVAAPPEEIISRPSTIVTTGSLSKQISEYISHQRSLLGFNIRFPYLMDEVTARNAQLRIQGDCKITHPIKIESFQSFPNQSFSNKTIRIYSIKLALVLVLFIFQLILILIVYAYKFSDRFRTKLHHIYRDFSN